jgi:hypothetical protein
MLTAIRAYWHRQALALRDAYRELYRHYRLEYRHTLDRSERTEADRAMLQALARVHDEQRDQVIERQVRRYAEAARFVTKEPKR